MKVSRFLFACTCLSMLIGCGNPAGVPAKKIIPAARPANIQTEYQGKMAEVCVERALYADKNDSMLYLHFQIYNLSQDTIGVAIKDRQRTLRSNSWSFLDTTWLTYDGDEMVNVYKAYSQRERNANITLFKEGRLENIPPGGVLEYYDRFWTERDVLRQSKDTAWNFQKIRVSIKGRIEFTDGKTDEDVFYGDAKDGGNNFDDLRIDWPCRFLHIPEGAIIPVD